jgi:hypothetical protein
MPQISRQQLCTDVPNAPLGYLRRKMLNPATIIQEKFNSGIKIIMIGEDHRSHATPRLFARLISQLRGSGITHLALEMSTEHQKLIDKYMTDGIRTHELYDKVSVCLRWIEILESARKEGLQVVCFDTRISKDDVHTKEEEMAQLILSKTNPNSRVLSYSGSGHAAYHTIWGETTETLKKANFQPLGHHLQTLTKGSVYTLSVITELIMNGYSLEPEFFKQIFEDPRLKSSMPFAIDKDIFFVDMWCKNALFHHGVVFTWETDAKTKTENSLMEAHRD